MELCGITCSILCGFFMLTLATAQHNGNEKMQKAFACEGQNLTIRCEDSRRLHVIRANYGRFSLRVCNPANADTWTTKCMAHTSMQVLSERCNGKSSCSVRAVDETFGDDPCPKTPKYLEVNFACLSEATSPPPVITKASPVLFQSRVFAVTTPMTTTTEKTTTTTEVTTTSKTTSTTMKKDEKYEDVVETTQRPVVKQEEAPFSASLDSPQMKVATEFCPAIQWRGLNFRSTAKGATEYAKCPGQSEGYVKWSCDRSSPPMWLGEPDFSGCRSRWLDSIRKKLSENVALEKVAEDLARMSAEKEFQFGEDVSVAVDFLDSIVNRKSERLVQGVDNRVPKLVELVQKTGSHLIGEEKNATWSELSEEMRAEKATQLLKAMESAAFMLAGNAAPGTVINSADKNIVVNAGNLQIREQVDGYQLFAKQDEKEISVIEFPVGALRQYAEPNGTVRVIFLAYKNIGNFLSSVGDQRLSPVYSPPSGYVINSQVVSAAIDGRQERDLAEPVVITFQHNLPKGKGKPVCAYWNFQAGKGKEFSGQWSTKGCWVMDGSDEWKTVCQCSHLTNFAVLMDVTGTVAKSSHSVPLSNITYIGCSVSIVCLFVTLLIFVFSKSIQSERTTIHKNLVLCLLVAEIFFVAGINQTHLPTGCNVFGMIMHYFFLATFMWALFEGINIWLLLVEVFQSGKSYKLWYYLCGYGAPLITVIISAVIDFQSYATADYCWLRADNYFILAFVVPVGLVIMANLVFLSVALFYMCRNVGIHRANHYRDVESWKNTRRWIYGAFGLVFVLCITWIFGFLYLGNPQTIFFAYVFTILNSFQGVFIFVLICLRNDKVKVAIRECVMRQAGRLSGSFCARTDVTDFSCNGRPPFYSCGSPLDQEKYVASFAPCWASHHLGQCPVDTSRRGTSSSVLPPNSPQPTPQCNCMRELTSTRFSNRDSGHESVSCPSADSPPMHPIHIHQRTQYPPSAARKHASQMLKHEYPATAARIAARSARGGRGIYCGHDGREHIYAEIGYEETGPYSDPSDESNTSVYQINGSEISIDEEQHGRIPVEEMEARRAHMHHQYHPHIGAENKPLISTLSRVNMPERNFRTLGHPVHLQHPSCCSGRVSVQNMSLRKNPCCGVGVQGLDGGFPYVNSMPSGPRITQEDLAKYQAFGLTATRDGGPISVRRLQMPTIADVPSQNPVQNPTAFSEC